MKDDGEDKNDSKRRIRNLSEKKRRDQFNLLISELSSLVLTNSRKTDKSTVLKSTISFLKKHNEITVRSSAHDNQDDWKVKFLSNEEFSYLMLEALEGFMVVFSISGRICYVSDSISSLLGHNPADIVNKSLFELVFKDDQQIIYDLLQRPGNITDPIQAGKENPIQFHCHIRRRSLNFAKEVIYELIQFNGHFRMNTEVLHNDDLLHYRQGNENRIIFVCTGRLSNPQLIRDVCLVDSNRSDFTSRHSLEWKFLFLDHRAPPIIGYLPFEVLGTSGYDYYHFDDLEKVITCHEALMQKGELTSCYYRFLTKGQQWIWLQTRFFITYHQWNSKPECVVCTHRVVSYADMETGMNQEGTEVDVNSDTDLNKGAIEDAPVENATLIVSPSYVSEESNPYGNSYQPLSQTPSVKSTSASSTTGTVSTIQTVTTEGVSWLQHNQQYFMGSEAASVSSDSASSLRNNKQNEQLQRKHEELQEIIVRQQEELRQVKEQLLLARLGILQPIINVNPTQNEYVSSEEAQQIGQLPAPPPDYDTTARHGNNAYQQQQAPNDRTNLPQ